MKSAVKIKIKNFNPNYSFRNKAEIKKNKSGKQGGYMNFNRKRAFNINKHVKRFEKNEKFINQQIELQAREKERKRIAEDLHDFLGGVLFSAHMKAAT